jgi:CBS domain-containing protein
MNVGKICRTTAITVHENDDLAAAANLMREHHIGYLIVARAALADGSLVPIDVLTDRDVVVKVIAKNVDHRTLRVGDVMTQRPVVAKDSDDLKDALRTMRRVGVRRLPVVGALGQLKGVLSLDDILDVLADELNSLAGSTRKERNVEDALLP